MNVQRGIYLVGGAVRDIVMGINPRDKDYLVVGYEPDELISKGFTHTSTAGGFPVFHHPVTKEEYALARTETKNGIGYKGFDTLFSPDVSIEDDLSRRDLTINAMAATLMPDINGYTVVKDIIDPYNGQADIKFKMIRHLNISLDPLRVYRIGRFLAKFGPDWKIAQETIEYCKSMPDEELMTIHPARVWIELKKVMNTENPRLFFDFLKYVGKLHIMFPEIHDLVDCQENLKWHPEGNTYEHTMLVLQEGVKRGVSFEAKLACLFHDIGKPKAAYKAKQNPKNVDRVGFFPAHDIYGASMVNAISRRFEVDLSHVSQMVNMHMKLHVLKEMRKDSIFKMLSVFNVRHEERRINDFLDFGECDAHGRLGSVEGGLVGYKEFLEPYIQAIKDTTFTKEDFELLKKKNKSGIDDINRFKVKKYIMKMEEKNG